MKQRYRHFFYAAALLLAVMWASCSRKIYVPVEHTRYSVVRDTLREAYQLRDSIVSTDSVIILTRGDTVYHTAWRTRYRQRVVSDTVQRICRDTLYIREQRVAGTAAPVAAPKRRWPTIMASGLLLSALLFFFGWLLRRFGRLKNNL